MTESKTFSKEVKRLVDVLNADRVSPAILDSNLGDFSDESKNQLVDQIAQSLEPSQLENLLTRLHFILTDDNREEMIKVFLTNLHSPYPRVRRASLHGLKSLEYQNLSDVALDSLSDDSEQVLVAVCDILIPKANEDLKLKTTLQQFYLTHKDEEKFYLLSKLLESHGFNQSS